MSNPLVCGIMLTRDRPELALRAVECFKAQTYQRKMLVIVDNNTKEFSMRFSADFPLYQVCAYEVERRTGNERRRWSIGELRNFGCQRASMGHIEGNQADIFMHFDDDDWSSPERMADQVFQLEATGTDVVGYSDMLFWREPTTDKCPCDAHDRAYAKHCPAVGEAWLYTAHKGGCPVLGTSLAYRREYWQKRPFPDQPRPGFMASEYKAWVNESRVDAKSSLRRDIRHEYPDVQMVARIHAGNSKRQNYQLEELIQRGSLEWKRVPNWDEKLKGLMV
jgi:O-antigen biosynthesis protein